MPTHTDDHQDRPTGRHETISVRTITNSEKCRKQSVPLQKKKKKPSLRHLFHFIFYSCTNCPLQDTPISFFLKPSLEFYFHFLPKTSPGQFIFFDFTSEIEKPLVDWLRFFRHSFPDQRSPQTSIEPGLVHCLVRNQDWERRPTTTTTWHPS